MRCSANKDLRAALLVLILVFAGNKGAAGQHDECLYPNALLHDIGVLIFNQNDRPTLYFTRFTPDDNRLSASGNEQSGYNVSEVSLGIPDHIGTTVNVIVGSARGIVGDTAQVTIQLENGNDVAGIELHLAYWSHELRYVGAEPGVLQDWTVNATSEAVHLIWEDLYNPLNADSPTEVILLEFELLQALTDSTELVVAAAEIVNTLGDPYDIALSSGWVVFSAPTAVDVSDHGQDLPSRFYLSANYPNPFNPETRIAFGLPKRIHIDLSVYNILGRLIRTIANGEYPGGRHEVSWDGRNDTGNPASSGIYLCRLETAAFTGYIKMILVR